MENERATDKLSKYILIVATIVLIGALCWYFSNVIIYILLAFVTALIGRPIMHGLEKIHIKNKKLPTWVNTIITLLILILCILLIFTQLIPIVNNILKEISMADLNNIAKSLSVPLHNFNHWLIGVIPSLGEDFRIEYAILTELQNFFSFSQISNTISSLAGSIVTFLVNFGVGAFAVIFISFFFIRDKNLFSKMIAALVPDKYEEKTKNAIANIEHLMSRYFVGLIIEVTGVALINFLGLMLIARLGFNASIGLAFMTGILNVIPYVGPLMGGAIGTILAVLLKLCSPIGLDVNIWIFAIILIAIFCFTQLIDNMLFQPLIYSSSIMASPLEIFIVLLMAGHIGGMLGMLVAIPTYTAIRVIACTFFGDVKAIKRLVSKTKE